MQTYDSLLEELKQHLDNPVSMQKLQEFGRSPLLFEHELLKAAYALLVQRDTKTSIPLEFTRLKSGALPLFGRSLFPWGALPYPKEHARLGVILAQMEATKHIANEMGAFQQASLDHNLKPIASLFSQEKGFCAKELEQANADFFRVIQKVSENPAYFVDQELAMICKKTDCSTILCLGSGCKSGLGAFLVHDVGVVNYGPQLSPVGDCSGFGFAGRAQNIQLTYDERQFSLSSLCRLASPNSRDTGFSTLHDSGYSALWMETTLKGGEQRVDLNGCLRGNAPMDEVVLTVFGKAPVCKVAGSHKLVPRSLDRYQGPVQPLQFCSPLAQVRVELQEGADQMEIIPLAGDESFWGSDFLVTYRLTAPTFSLLIS